MSAKKQCTCDSGPDVAGAYHSDPACPVHFPKKRPKVPRDLSGLFWRVRYRFGNCDHLKRSDALVCRKGDQPSKLYRVTVWRKK